MSDNRTDEQADFIEKLHTCARNRDDIQIFDVDYVACPLDADGVPIHIDDVMRQGYGRVLGKVWAIADNVIMFEHDFKDGYSRVECFDANTLRHKKPNPVEEILAEYRQKAMSLHNNYLGDFSLSFNEYSKQLDELDAEYAQKLMRISELCTAMDILLKGDNDD